MATKIVTKNSSTASAVPTASDLVQGELAVNVADKRLFTEDNGGSIVELGTNPSTIDINAGSIDGTAIGASSASTGAFTTLTATGAFTSRGIDDNADATAITIDSSENVGIGTSSPTLPLSVDGDIWQGNTGGVEIGRITNNAGWYDFGASSNVNGAQMSHPAIVRFNTNNTERLRIDSSGNVGIGTSSPTADLSVGSTTTSSGDIHLRTTKTAASITPSNSDAGGLDIGVGWVAGGQGPLTFSVGVEAMRIDSSGNLLVGTTSPSTTSNIYASGASGNAFAAGFDAASASSAAAAFSNPNDGAVLRFYRAWAGSGVGSINVSASATAYNTSSDQRLKENIADADDAGSKIDAIQVRQYDWKADGSHQDYGMIAQELVEVAPEAVTVPADSEEMMGVDYSKLVPMLIKEIQSLRNRVAQLEE